MSEIGPYLYSAGGRPVGRTGPGRHPPIQDTDRLQARVHLQSAVPGYGQVWELVGRVPESLLERQDIHGPAGLSLQQLGWACGCWKAELWQYGQSCNRQSSVIEGAADTPQPRSELRVGDGPAVEEGQLGGADPPKNIRQAANC